MLIHKLRLVKGWSQQQLSELSGVSVRTIQRLEGGQAGSPETLKALAAVFEIDFTELTKEPAMTSSYEPLLATFAEEQLALRHVRKLRGFYGHLIYYVVVILGLAAINLFTSRHTLWFIWPMLGWGIGILAHGLRTFDIAPFGAAWEKRQVEKQLGRPLL